jgi:hypothetical protein
MKAQTHTSAVWCGDQLTAYRLCLIPRQIKK